MTIEVGEEDIKQKSKGKLRPRLGDAMREVGMGVGMLVRMRSGGKGRGVGLNVAGGDLEDPSLSEKEQKSCGEG